MADPATDATETAALIIPVTPRAARRVRCRAGLPAGLRDDRALPRRHARWSRTSGVGVDRQRMGIGTERAALWVGRPRAVRTAACDTSSSWERPMEGEESQPVTSTRVPSARVPVNVHRDAVVDEECKRPTPRASGVSKTSQACHQVPALVTPPAHVGTGAPGTRNRPAGHQLQDISPVPRPGKPVSTSIVIPCVIALAIASSPC
jgi:hypothetical protein